MGIVIILVRNEETEEAIGWTSGSRSILHAKWCGQKKEKKKPPVFEVLDLGMIELESDSKAYLV